MNNHDMFEEMQRMLNQKMQEEMAEKEQNRQSTMNKTQEKQQQNQQQQGFDQDFEEIIRQAQNPATLALLLYKLTKEREKTNMLLEEMLTKFEETIKELKENSASSTSNTIAYLTPTQKIEILPEQDQMILNLIAEKGQVTAQDVQKALSYKGQNAASQRLMKLYKEGYLQKIQAGRKVLYIGKTP